MRIALLLSAALSPWAAQGAISAASLRGHGQLLGETHKLDTTQEFSKPKTEPETPSAEDSIKELVDQVSSDIDDGIKQIDEITQDALEGMVTKDVMSKINKLRVKMCLARPELFKHKPCLKFLGLVCNKETSGEGLCKHFFDRATVLCHEKEKCIKSKGEAACEAEITACHEATGEKDQLKHADIHGVASEDHDEDGANDLEDAFPDDPKEQLDTDHDFIGDHSDEDIDGDDVKNAEDAFPTNKTEWADTDGDGIGDNVDDDIDGDGHKNENDAFPKDPKHFKDSDGDGIPDDEDADRDGDGQHNNEDVFPDDPKEWLDSDKDGVGDNADAYPFDPNCSDEDKPCEVTGNAKAHAVKTDKVEKPLPPQGYNEEAIGPLVEHDDAKTYTGDWRGEWPTSGEEMKETFLRICKKNPKNRWCIRLKEQLDKSWWW
mmetsp:Transcript_52010/g.112728  ORF Transcript_52010/g.112728 Transcript_52010/m.112728 type:complete len:432 (+) Transcript_52010:58-1353(+)